MEGRERDGNGAGLKDITYPTSGGAGGNLHLLAVLHLLTYDYIDVCCRIVFQPDDTYLLA